MRVAFRRALGVSRLLCLLVLLALSQAPGPLHAQTQGESAALDQRLAFQRFATQYTETVLTGLLAGALIMNQLVGGSSATLTGAVVGSSMASWLFVNQQARNYVVQRAAPRQSR